MTGYAAGSAIGSVAGGALADSPPASLQSRSGFGLWISLFAGIVVTILLYVPMLWIALRFGLKL